MYSLSDVELALAALLLEATIGYPAVVYRAIGHPVTWMGALIASMDGRLNRLCDPDDQRRRAGMLTLFVLLAVTAGIAFAVVQLAPRGTVGVIVLVVAASSLPAQRSLQEHVRAVADALKTGGLPAGRKAVSMIVGRDTDQLDEAGVARAAIESLAENFSDGIVAPVFWLAVGGLPAAACYKAANTADSMIGHRSPRYATFGWAAARFDDLINLPASRLSALLLILAAAVTGASPTGAARAVWRDARRHRSPNAGWPEAAMAGALGLRLAGPRVYNAIPVDDAFMGNGRREATADDILRALALYCTACVAEWLLLVAAILLI
jgi:adenosylcobinamide-phosphate synthase